MYVPYFRGKQYEIRTLMELAPLLMNSGRVVPLIEPVRESASDVKDLSKLAHLGVPLIVIENPAKGDLADNHGWTRSLLDRLSTTNVHPALLVTSSTTAKAAEGFLKRHKDRSIAFVHMGSVGQPDKVSDLQGSGGNVAFNVFLSGKSGKEYRETFPLGKRIILEDGFERQAKNGDYPPHDFFSDRFRTFKADGYDGFGDFLTVGNHFTKSGGGAYAVAIHLTNLESGGIIVRHFVSDRKTLQNVDTAGKFFEALEKARTFIRSRQNWRVTEGCREFLTMPAYKGLGFVKKVSMKHHVELLDAVLESEKGK